MALVALSPRVTALGQRPQQLPNMIRSDPQSLIFNLPSSAENGEKNASLNSSFLVSSQPIHGRPRPRTSAIEDATPRRENPNAESNVDQFEMMLEGPEELRGLTMKQIEQKFRALIVSKYHDLKRAFVAFDRKGNGLITIDEFKRVLFNFIFPMPALVFEQLMERCGTRASHDLAYESFLQKFQPTRRDDFGQTLPIKSNHVVFPVRTVADVITSRNLRNFLRTFVESRHATLKEAFQKFDYNKDGFISYKEFRRIMKHFNIEISGTAFSSLMNEIDQAKSGRISYLRFLDMFEDRETEDGHPWLRRSHFPRTTHLAPALDQATVEKLIRDKLQDNWRHFTTAFMSADANKDGSISRTELANLLNRYALQLTPAQFEKMWKRCDVNEDDRIQFSEFLERLGINILADDTDGFSRRIHEESERKKRHQTSNQRSRHDRCALNQKNFTVLRPAEDILALLKEKMNNASTDFRRLFVKYDTDGDGKISKDEFKKLLNQFSIELNEDQLTYIYSQMNFRNGKLTYFDFLDFFQETCLLGERELLLRHQNNGFKGLDEPPPSMKPDEVLEIMRRKMEEGSRTIREAFHQVDRNHDGLVNKRDFRRIIDRCMVTLTDTDFHAVMAQLGFGTKTNISYKQFLELFERKEDFQKGHPWLFAKRKWKDPRPPENIDFDSALRILKEKAADQWENLQTAFRSFDRDGNAIVTMKEMKNVLHRFNIPVHTEVLRLLWQHFDEDNNGHVDHGEFLRRLGADLAPGDAGVSLRVTKESQAKTTEHQEDQNARIMKNPIVMNAMEVERHLRDRFRDKFESFRKAFEHLDSNRDGFLSRADLLKALSDQHFNMDDTELAKLLSRIGLGNKTKISYVQFLQAFADPRASGDGRITLDSPVNLPEPVVFENAANLKNEEALLLLRGKVAQKAEALRQAFKAFDSSSTGHINKKDLHQIVNAFCVVLSESQFKYLLLHLDVDDEGNTSYKQFMDSFKNSEAEASLHWLDDMDSQLKCKPPQYHVSSMQKGKQSSVGLSPRSQGVVSPGREVSNQVDVLSPPSTASDVERRIEGKMRMKWKDLIKSFRGIDSKGTGEIEPHLFKGVLEEFDIFLSPSEMKSLLRKYDPERECRMPYASFMKKLVLQSRMAQTKTSQGDYDILLSVPVVDSGVASIIQSVKEDVRYQWKSMRRTFRNLDRPASGTCSVELFRDVLRKHNIDLLEVEYAKLAEFFASVQPNCVSYNDFLKHVVAL